MLGVPTPSRIDLDGILSESRALLEEGGPDVVTMRELARRLGVSAPSLYFHVRGREQILGLLIRRALAELGDDMAAIDVESDPASALHRLGDTYASFAFANPHLFAITFGPCPVGAAPDLESGAKASEALFRAVAAIDPAADVLDLAQAFWSLVHGYATLALAGQFRMGGDPARALHRAIALLVVAISGDTGKEVGRSLSSS